MAADTPRQSPDFAVNMNDGSQIHLSQYQGKVVVLAFILTYCSHCQFTAQILSRLQKEYGPQGLQVVASAIDPMSSMKVPDFIKRIKSGEAGNRLMGFGHRVYKSYDPRAKVIKRIADIVFTVTGKNPLLEIALELERIALADDYFVSRKLYPNVDFYSGLIYQAMGFPVEMFPVLFAIPRTAGWIAQWEEMLVDPEQKIARPRQVYIGPVQRAYIPREKRA